MSRGAFIFALLLVVLIVGIVAMKANGAVDHPILVDASVSKAAEPAMVVPWRLYTTCPVERQNIPTLPDSRRA